MPPELAANVFGRHPGDHEIHIERITAPAGRLIRYRCKCIGGQLWADPSYDHVYIHALAHVAGVGGTIWDHTQKGTLA